MVCSCTFKTPLYTAGFERDLVTNDFAKITTSSQISMWPTIETCPAIWQLFPIFVLPAIAVCAAIAVFLPIITLWAIWIWLSNFTPFARWVFPIAPLSIVQFAPISTSFPIIVDTSW